MCEFCKKHGEGKIWYKNASNYSQDLLSDLNRRKYIEQFLSVTIGEGFKSLLRLEALLQKRGRLPEQIINRMVENSKIEHFGQVIPIEDVKEIVNKSSSIVRLPCACRWTIDKSDLRCCYGITYHPDSWIKHLDMSYFGKPPTDLLESLNREEALRQMEEIEHKGAIHTIWTFVTPFIGAICNCTVKYCIAMRTHTGIQVETMFRGEYIARVDKDVCTGCSLCLESCQFQAIDSFYEGGRYLALIDAYKCFGCGLCRNACDAGAITLIPRANKEWIVDGVKYHGHF